MIEVDRLTKFNGSIPAISELAFTVTRGEVIGFFGPPGVGKTTTQEILTCFQPPTSSQARINGPDIRRHALRLREQTGYLRENVPLPTEMPVDRFSFLPGKPKG
jgi:ABC-2 type transport system ATP-binding protein